MRITLEWLKKENACQKGVEWFKKQKLSEGPEVIKSLIKDNKLDWANWTIVRLMDHPKKIRYAVFAAEQAIDIYEKKYPDDERPRNAIEAVKKYLEDPSEENKNAAYAAANAATAAANTAANTAAYAAYAAYAAAYAAYAADAANAAYAARVAANAAAYAAKDKMKTQILKYGLKILGSK